ncbi:uncharacterized protein PG986_011667 [Apiospora aurea]|uniref:Uncharacterized protein n=1 Tax=Apiospora aurea TaxID=335848 RepID=A0ABR1PXS4_9PEZI
MIRPVLATISEWAPFQLDALGLVTIFGAKEMNMSIGNLVQSWATEWVPVLGSYAVANNELTEPGQGFILYNITDGIMATDVAAWFTRWLMSYQLNYTSTTIRLRTSGRPMSTTHRTCAFLIGACVMLLSLCFSILTADPWGIANSAIMAFQVLVRQGMVGQLRGSVDRAVEAIQDNPGPGVKVFLTLPNGKAVTILGLRQMVVNCILSEARPVQPRYYFMLRVTGWALFGGHAITLGMSNLFNQMITVAVLLLGTYVTAIHVGDFPQAIGARLRLEIDMGDPTWNRSRAYARLNMSPEEEDNMVHWNMMPQRSNLFWWNRYTTTHKDGKQAGPPANSNVRVIEVAADSHSSTST